MLVDEAVKYKAESGSRFGTSVTPNLTWFHLQPIDPKWMRLEQSVLHVALLNNVLTAGVL